MARRSVFSPRYSFEDRGTDGQTDGQRGTHVSCDAFGGPGYPGHSPEG